MRSPWRRDAYVVHVTRRHTARKTRLCQYRSIQSSHSMQYNASYVRNSN